MKKIIGASFAEMFELRAELPKRTRTIIFLFGIVLLFLSWYLMAEYAGIKRHVLPHPFDVAIGLVELLFGGKFLPNFLVSLKLNILGYLVAIAIGIPVGFLIGLFPFFDALWGRWLTALRFWPITAALCAFMAALGSGTKMKVVFLAVTILVFLIAAVAQRIRSVDETKVQKVRTLGFSKWQIIRHVFIPQGLGWSWDDISNLVAISWTYIVFIEMINRAQGGVGSYIWNIYYRGHRTDLLWGVMILLIVWGAIQDRLFHLVSRLCFAWKFGKRGVA